MVKIYSRYDVPVCEGVVFTEPTRTQQQFKDETDINKIVARAIQTGDATVFTTAERGSYYDSSTFTDYRDALQIISDIDDDFFSLPSSVRRHFDDDPDAYVAFMADPNNYEQAVELGLLEGSGEPPAASPSSAPEQPPAGPSETKNTQSDA